MQQGDLFFSVCGTLKDTSSSDADLTVSTSTDATGQIHTDAYECRTCGIVQPIWNFPTHHADRKSMCKSCTNGHRKDIAQLRAENDYPDDDYTCPICAKDIEELGKYDQPMMKTWVLDHCHTTKTFRGWLCRLCNDGLGRFKDSKELVNKAYTYLQEHDNKNGL